MRRLLRPPTRAYRGLLVSALRAFHDSSWVLILDHSQWQFGRADINFLVLGIVWRGVSWPVLWTVLPKRGNSNTAERIALVERFMALFGAERIAWLLADREFVGHEWLAYLHARGLRFRIRVKQDTLLADAHGHPVVAWMLFCDIKGRHPGCSARVACGGWSARSRGSKSPMR
jgi:hypothetical protein